ncbi:MFS transporter [Streptomyces sp. NPDC007988]|uniref:MFS transporter n=1 Tax=Streptomyces sp. NPDC007988 TaxID=3364802 RepID=UPI0036F039A4
MHEGTGPGVRAYLPVAFLARLADEGVAVAVVTLALHRTGSAAQGAFVLMAWMAPHVLAAPAVGAVAARARSARLLYGCGLAGFGTAIAALAATVGRAPAPVTYAVAAAGGCLGPLVTGALSSLLGALTPAGGARDRAYALDAAVYNAASVAGPGAAAALAALAAPGPALLLLAAAALGSAALTLALPPGTRPFVGQPRPSPGPEREEFIPRPRGAEEPRREAHRTEEPHPRPHRTQKPPPEPQRTEEPLREPHRTDQPHPRPHRAEEPVPRTPRTEEPHPRPLEEGPPAGPLRAPRPAPATPSGPAATRPVPARRPWAGPTAPAPAPAPAPGTAAHPRLVPPRRARRALGRLLSDGQAAVWRTPEIRAITAATSLAFVGVGGLTTTAVLLGHGGALMTGFALGALAGSLAVARRPPRMRVARLAEAGLLGLGLALAAAAVAVSVGPPALGLPLFALAGLCDGVVLTATLRIRSDFAPPGARPQVFTLGAGLKITAAAAGAGLTGLLAERPAALLLLCIAALQLAAALLHALLAPAPGRGRLRGRRARTHAGR